MFPDSRFKSHLYMYICDVYKFSLRFHCQRFGCNTSPEFTDGEILA